MFKLGQKSYFVSLAGRQLLNKQPDSEFSKKGEAFETRFRNRGEKGTSNYPEEEVNINQERQRAKKKERKKEKDEKARTDAESEQYASSDILGKGDGDNLLAAVQTTFCHSTPLKACYVYVPCMRELSEIKIKA